MNSEKVKEIKEFLQNYIKVLEEENAVKVAIDRFRDILTLINELESENERLGNLFDAQRIVAKQRLAKLEKAEHDRDRYQRRITELEKGNKDYYDRLNNLQSYIDNHEEVWKGNTKIQLKQFAERLKEKMGVREYMGVKYKQGVFSENEIDEILKEFEL